MYKRFILPRSVHATHDGGCEKETLLQAGMGKGMWRQEEDVAKSIFIYFSVSLQFLTHFIFMNFKLLFDALKNKYYYILIFKNNSNMFLFQTGKENLCKMTTKRTKQKMLRRITRERPGNEETVTLHIIIKWLLFLF